MRVETDERAAAERRRQGLSFGPAAALYDSVRPSYPREAVDWALTPLGPGHWHIGDVGAGTGIMTRLLRTLGHHVVAVEPDPGMRQRLVETTPEVTAVEGSAESIPLGQGSLDGAVAAQSYHWFDHDRAHAELARVIRPGGVFAAIWNERDESKPWLAEYSRIVEGHRGHDSSGPDHGPVSFGPLFGDVQLARFGHSARHTSQSLVRLMQSRSYYLTSSPERQRSMTQDVLALTRTHPDLAGRDEFEVAYITTVHRAVRAEPSERQM